jgi:Ca2+-binding EF-hand superfamily protein
MANSALRARFDRYDSDRNGQIDQTEFSTLLDALGLGYEEAQVRAAFTSLDADQDGQINFTEFSDWWLGR